MTKGTGDEDIKEKSPRHEWRVILLKYHSSQVETQLSSVSAFVSLCRIDHEAAALVSVRSEVRGQAHDPRLPQLRSDERRWFVFRFDLWPLQEWCWLWWSCCCCRWISGSEERRAPPRRWRFDSRTAPSTMLCTGDGKKVFKSENQIKPVSSWGEVKRRDVFSPGDIWSLTRCSLHQETTATASDIRRLQICIHFSLGWLNIQMNPNWNLHSSSKRSQIRVKSEQFYTFW